MSLLFSSPLRILSDSLPVKEDGTPDKRMSSEHGFGGDRERASEAGKAGGSAEKYKPTEHDGCKSPTLFASCIRF